MDQGSSSTPSPFSLLHLGARALLLSLKLVQPCTRRSGPCISQTGWPLADWKWLVSRKGQRWLFQPILSPNQCCWCSHLCPGPAYSSRRSLRDQFPVWVNRKVYPMMWFALLMPRQALGVPQHKGNYGNCVKDNSLNKPSTLFISNTIFRSFQFICWVPYYQHLYFLPLTLSLQSYPPIFFFRDVLFHFYFKMSLKYNALFSKMSLLASDMHSRYVLFLI